MKRQGDERFNRFLARYALYSVTPLLGFGGAQEQALLPVVVSCLFTMFILAAALA